MDLEKAIKIRRAKWSGITLYEVAKVTNMSYLKCHNIETKRANPTTDKTLQNLKEREARYISAIETIIENKKKEIELCKLQQK